MVTRKQSNNINTSTDIKYNININYQSRNLLVDLLQLLY